MEASALDPLLVDPTTASTASQAANQDPLLNNFNSMTGGDPLLNDLNNLDNASLAGLNPADPAAAQDAALNQDLTSFLMQQASSTYSASQLLGNTQRPSSGSTGALGHTTA